MSIEALRVKVYFTHGKMRLDVSVEVKKAIGYEIPIELVASESVAEFETSRCFKRWLNCFARSKPEA